MSYRSSNPKKGSLEAWKKDHERLNAAYQRQQKLIEGLQEQNRAAKAEKADAVKRGTRLERDRHMAEKKRIKSAGALTAKATTAASTAVVGYYLLAEELGTMWIVSESFSRSEWFQAILTSVVAWLLAQCYAMVAAK